MKSKTISFVSSKIKPVIIVACVVFGFAVFTNCNAQSIVGKWKGVSVKNFYNAEFAKKTGKSMEEKFPKDVGNSDIEYKQDHTFIMSFSPANSTEVTTMTGTWSLTGDQLKLTLEPQYNPGKMTTTATISINGSTMVTTAVMPPGSRITKTISIGSRM
jgi:hypothetical protein